MVSKSSRIYIAVASFLTGLFLGVVVGMAYIISKIEVFAGRFVDQLPQALKDEAIRYVYSRMGL